MTPASRSAESAATQSVFVSKLTLSNYRCYGRATITPDCKRPLVVLTGPNGAGKTNVLEAISYLAPGRGLRRAGLAEVARQVPEGGDTDAAAAGTWAVAATLQVGTEPVKVGTGIERPADDATSKRLVRVDGENASNSNVLGER